MNDLVKAKLIELVPEITDLKFGCKIRMASIEGSDYTDTISQAWKEPAEWWYRTVGGGGINYAERDFKEILGRPITLADILRAIDIATSEKESWYIRTDGKIQRANSTYISAQWNLLEHWDNQTDEVKAFVGKLIGV